MQVVKETLITMRTVPSPSKSRQRSHSAHMAQYLWWVMNGKIKSVSLIRLASRILNISLYQSKRV